MKRGTSRFSSMGGGFSSETKSFEKVEGKEEVWRRLNVAVKRRSNSSRVSLMRVSAREVG